MHINHIVRKSLLLAVTLLLLSDAGIQAGSRFNNGSTFLSTDKLKKAKKLDRTTSAIEIPSDIDQSQPLEYFCLLQTQNEDPDDFTTVAVKNVKARWQADAYLLDHRDGAFQVIDVSDGTFKTSTFGAEVSILLSSTLRAAIFTDGFESGDVSALLVTSASFTKGKKLNNAALQCSLSDFRE